MLLRVLFLLVFSVSSVFADNVLVHKIAPGKFHKSGRLEITLGEANEKSLNVKIKYQLKKRFFLPVSNSKLKGQTDLDIPVEFKDLDGYLSLERSKKMSLLETTIEYLGLADFNQFYDCIKFRITPDNHEWSGEFLYHPDAPAIGWVKAQIIYYDLGFIDQYVMSSSIVL